MRIDDVLISGAGIAGPALALLLSRAGIRTTIVEKAPWLRTGGQAVDFRGRAQLEVLEHMGLLDEVRRRQTHAEGLTLADEHGHPACVLPPAFMSGDLEILRGDLCELLHRATRERTEYVFDDSIRSLADDGSGVVVQFERGGSRRFDLVVGADGLRSRVRSLAFGADDSLVTFLDHYVAVVPVENRLGLERRGVMMSAPGRGLLVGNDGRKTIGIFLHRDTARGLERAPLPEKKRRLQDVYGGLAGQVRGFVEDALGAPEIFFDAVARVDLDGYTRGRAVLLGDAAWGGTLGGGGTGVAVVGAYVLAGEILASRTEPSLALRRYEARMTKYARRCQRGVNHVGGFFAPPTRAHITVRNLLYRIIASPWLVSKVTAAAANDFDLPEYVPA